MPEALNLRRHRITRRLILQKARRHTGAAFAASTVLRLLVGTGFQVLLTSLAGILFIGRSRYSFAIGHQLVLSLGRWASLIHAGFHVSGATWGHICAGLGPFSYGAITLFGWAFQSHSDRLEPAHVDGPATPGRS